MRATSTGNVEKKCSCGIIVNDFACCNKYININYVLTLATPN